MSISDPARQPLQRRSKETRVRLLEAAVQCLAEVGYADTTTSLILSRSGVSRGSLLHQFPSRDDLLIASVHHLAAVRMTELTRYAAERATQTADISEAVAAMWDVFHGDLFRATVELWTAARTNPTLRVALVPVERLAGQAVTGTVATVFGPELAARPGFDDLAAILLTSMRGTALTYMFNPRDHRTDPNLPRWCRLAKEMLDHR